MVFPKQLLILSVLATVLGAALTARARHNLQFEETFAPDAPIHSDGFVADQIQPFIDWDAFDYDFQAFAPLDRSLFGGETPDARTGFFLTYDRLYWNIPRSQSELTLQDANGTLNTNYVAQKKGDWTLGNRFNLGYMTENDHGWHFSLIHAENAYIDNPAEIGRRHETNFWSGELNKVYRIALNSGAFIEPYVGGRYMYLSDFTVEDVDCCWEFQEVQNEIVGGQIGVRFFKQKGHWLLQANTRMFAGYNTQFMVYQDTEGAVTGTTPDQGAPEVPFRDEQRLDEFVPAFELRLDATYYVTRDIALNFGVDFLHIFRGIARSNPAFPQLTENTTPPVILGDGITPFPTFNDKQITLPGIGVGLVWNR